MFSDIKNIIILVLGIITLGVFSTLYYYIGEYRQAVNDHNLYVKEQEVISAQHRATIERIRREAAEALAEKQKIIYNAEISHRTELNELQTKYDIAISDVKRLRDNISYFNTNWAKWDDTTKQDYARAGADGLAACLVQSAEVERLAYGYNSEVVFLRTFIANHISNPSFKMYDPKTGASVEYSTPIEVQIKPDSIKDVKAD